MATSFLPKDGGKSTGSATISATTTSASASVEPTCPQIRVRNPGSVDVCIRWGKGAQTATTSDMPVGAGSTECFTKGDADTVAAITASGSATIVITSGHGD